MNLSTPALLALNFSLIFVSRFHLLSLHKNSFLIWLPCLGNLLSLVYLIAHQASEPSPGILAIALFGVSILFSIWSIACWGMQNRSQERAHRGVEFVSLQTFFLTLPILLPRIEMYAMSWLVSSWLWGLWRLSRRHSSILTARFHWSRFVLPLSDSIFFCGLCLFFTAGVFGTGVWDLPPVPPLSLKYGVLLLWLACLIRICIAPLYALMEDSNTVSDTEDLPYLFMQTVGFAFPAVLILLDENSGLFANGFETLAPWLQSMSRVASLFAATCSIPYVIRGRKTRTALGALCVCFWPFWLASLEKMGGHSATASAFCLILGLPICWVLTSSIEFRQSPARELRWLTRILLSLIFAGYCLLWPSAHWAFQVLPRDGFSFDAYFALATLSLICGRLIGTAFFWAENDVNPRLPQLWFVEAFLILAALTYHAIDFTIVASLEISISSLWWAMLFAAPYGVLAMVGGFSAKWLPPPPVPIVGNSTKIASPPRQKLLGAQVIERVALLIWYSPAFLVRATSRALANTNGVAVWMAIAALGAVLFIRKGG